MYCSFLGVGESFLALSEMFKPLIWFFLGFPYDLQTFICFKCVNLCSICLILLTGDYDK